MKASWRIWSIRCGCVALALAASAWALAPAGGQGSYNEREVKGQTSALGKTDKDEPAVWSFDFKFKDPRLIKVHVPGKGTRIYWYLWYQVINRTTRPERFIPGFDLVTLDNPAVYHDIPSPTVQDAIKRIEDPTGYQDIKNSVSISTLPIPVSTPDAFPRAVTGVAIWDGTPADPAKRDPKVKDLADSRTFSIFIRGLSNGYVEVDPIVPGDPPAIRIKTLQLNFRRTGDRNDLDARDITFVPPAEWVYRPGPKKMATKDAGEKNGK
jgi:hypothetical protein